MGTEIAGDPDFFLLDSCNKTAVNLLDDCWEYGPRVAQLNAGQTYYLAVDNRLVGSDAEYAIKVTFLGALAPIQSWHSVRTHGAAGSIGLDLSESNIEPRAGGVQRMDLIVDGFLYQQGLAGGSARVTCSDTRYDGAASLSLPAQNQLSITFDPALPDEDCCEVSVSGVVTTTGAGVAGSQKVRTLAGDVDRNGQVTTADTSLIKPHFQEPVDATTCRWDFNVDGVITTADSSLIKPLYQHVAPDCP